MSLSEVTSILSFLALLGIGGLAYLLKFSLPTYFNKKAENFATRQDIAKITDEVERVKSQYAFLLEELRARHQLRAAAVERRLEAHQQAYSLWRKLLSSVHGQEIGDIVVECQNWWNDNCPYLTPEARGAFYAAAQCAASHRDYLSVPAEYKDKTLIEKNWATILEAGEIIVSGAELPSLGEAEFRSFAEPADARQGYRQHGPDRDE